MIIEKTAKELNYNVKPLYFFESAREAFEQVLCGYQKKGTYTLLLPGYIGFSPNEGSGIFDPVYNTKTIYQFYPLDKKLRINCHKLEEILKKTTGKKVLLLVHYFGYPDENVEQVVRLCRNYETEIIEDAAHALYTDFIDHACGNYGDYIIYSLHKMLPFTSGGMLKINISDCSMNFKGVDQEKYPVFHYDLYEISCKRKANAQMWSKALMGKEKNLSILHPYSPDVTPQTFPIVVNGVDRNTLYFRLNEAGYGVVSLYHTMIEPIKTAILEDAIWLSQHILNLPVHQDVDMERIPEMAELLLQIISENEG